jgi:FdhD protein
VLRGGAPGSDLVAVEEPLEIRIAGEPLAVLMRTPGEDHRLALGFLYSEGLIRSAADLTAVFHCGRPGDEGYGNAIELTPASGARLDWERIDGARRGFVAGSGCGLCGRSAIAELLRDLEPPADGAALAASQVSAAVDALRDHQPTFAASGGTHVAALWDRGGALVAAHEDVGRHNAVDKVVGALLLAREDARQGGATPPEPMLLAVSSRAGLEVVHKAARARIPTVATVSAPTSSAIALAREAGLTLAAFVRGGRMNVYTHPDRIRAAPGAGARTRRTVRRAASGAKARARRSGQR